MRQKETASEFRRRRAVELIEEGESIAIIARFLGVSRQVVYHWSKKYQSGISLKTSPRSGRPIKVEDDRLDILRELLLRGATEHGWQNDLWTAKRVAEVIQRHLGVEYSIQSVRNRLRWTVQRPIQQEQERNEAEIQQWKEYTFPQIVEYAFKTGAHLVFVDAAGFVEAPTRRQTFAPRGKTLVIKVTN